MARRAGSAVPSPPPVPLNGCGPGDGVGTRAPPMLSANQASQSPGSVP